jgi:hypothetical protein
MTKCAFDVDAAVGVYFDAGGKKIAPMAAPAPAAASSDSVGSSSRDEAGPAEEEKTDDISKMMKEAKQMTPEEMRAKKSFGGQGRSIGSSGEDEVAEKNLRLTFYEDGFTVYMVEEAAPQTHRSDRRSGVHTYESNKKQELQELPPLRDYESNKKFIEDIKAHKVPEEFRGQWRVQIMLDDKRPAKYPPQAKDKRAAAFSGAGNSLGGSPARAAATGDGAAMAVQAPGILIQHTAY